MISKRHITARGHSVLGPKNPLLGGSVNTPFLINRLKTQIDCCNKLTISGILKGIAIDGYISGATVDVYDTKTNTKIASTITNQYGSWEITNSIFNESSDYYKIVVKGGTDVVSGNTIDIDLVSYGKPNTDFITITPTTTLISYLIDADTTPQRTFEQKLAAQKTLFNTLNGGGTQPDPFSHNFIEKNDVNIYKTNVKLYQYLSLYKNDGKKDALVTDIKTVVGETLIQKLVKPALNITDGTRKIGGKLFTEVATAIDSTNTINDLHDAIKTNIGKGNPVGSVQFSSQKGKSGATINVNVVFDTILDPSSACTIQLVDSTNTSTNLLSSAVTLTFGAGNKTASGTFTVPTGDKIAKVKFLTGKSLGGVLLAQTPSNNPSFIIDNTPPVITLRQPIVSEINLNSSYTDPGATATDAVDGPCTVTSSGTINPAVTGNQTITYSSTDAAGNTSSATRTIRVVDPNGPTIVLNGSNPIYLEAGTNFTFTDPGASATDSTGSVVTVTTDSLNGQIPATYINSVAKTTKATYTITYRATNSSGQTSTQTRTVVVRDTVGPVISLSPNVTSVNLEQKTGTLASVRPTATATDAVDGSRTVTITDNVNVNIAGTYQLTYTASDLSGNTTTKQVNVVVRDTTPPVITLLGSNPFQFEASNSNYVDPGATAVDAVDGNITPTMSGTVTKNVKGSYIIQYNATDSAGNAATPVSRTVNVVDTTPPVLTVPNTAINVSSDSSITTFDFRTGVSAFDIVDGDVTNNIKVSSDTPGIFPTQFTWNTSVGTKPTTIGTYNIYYDVSDSTNNAASRKTRSLTVAPSSNTPPNLSNVPSTTQNLIVNTPFDHTFGGIITATDVQDGDITNNITISCILEPITNSCVIINNAWNDYIITFTELGSYTLRYSITDSGGLTNVADVPIQIADIPINPVIILTNSDEMYYVKDDIENTNNSINALLLNKEEISAFAGATDITDDITLTVEKIYPSTNDNGNLIVSGTKFSNYQLSADNADINIADADQYGLVQNVYKITYQIDFNGLTDNKIRYLIIGNKKYKIGITSTISKYLPGEPDYNTFGKYIFTDISGCKSHIERMIRQLEDIIYRPLYGKTVINDVVANTTYNGYLNNTQLASDAYSKQGPFDFVIDVSEIISTGNGIVAADYYYYGEDYVLINNEQIRTQTQMKFNLFYYNRFSDLFINDNPTTALHEMLHGHRVGSDITFDQNQKPNNMIIIQNIDPSSNFVETMKFFKGEKTFNYYKKKLFETGFPITLVNSLIGVPLESTYKKNDQGGTSGAHWENNVTFDLSGNYYPPFYKDIMRGYSGSDRYLSKLTAYCLVDIGYPNINMRSKYIKNYSNADILQDAFSINYVNYKTNQNTWEHLDYYTYPFNTTNEYCPVPKDANGLVSLYISAFYYNKTDNINNIIPEIYATVVTVKGNVLTQQSSYIKMNINSSKSNYYDIHLLIGKTQPQTIPEGYNFVLLNDVVYTVTNNNDYAAIEFYYKNATGNYILLLDVDGSTFNLNDLKDDKSIPFTY